MERGGIAGVSGLRGPPDSQLHLRFKGGPVMPEMVDNTSPLWARPSSGAKNSALSSVEEGPQLYGTCSASRVSC